IVPSLLMVACSTTWPWMRAVLAIAGYCGLGPEILLPATTPDDTLTFCGAATFGGGSDEPTIPPRTPPILPPATPPGTPPTTPAIAGGASSSFTIFTLSGILVGARS